MSRVLDASVAVKCFVRESGSDEALEALRRSDTISAPDLLVAEVCNVVWKKARRGEIASDHATRIVRALPTLVDRFVPTLTLAARAFAIATELDHPVYDGIYLALTEAEQATLVTDDTRLLHRVRGTPWETLVEPLRGWPAR